MIKRKISVIALSLILLTSFVYSVIATSRNIDLDGELLIKYNDGGHVIENPMVPYVGQGNDSYCMHASTTMQIKYLGFNISLPEILHDLGHGYLHVYFRFLPPFRTPFGGSGLSTAIFNMELLTDAYNLTFNDDSFYRDNTNISLWDTYYTKVKAYIRKDIPIQTHLDPYRLTFWNERFNFSNDTVGGHAVVIVGYNDSNNSICYNDPSAAIFNESENGTYIWERNEIFKKAVESGGLVYRIWTFEKPSSFIMPTRIERFQKFHEYNIKRLKGDLEYIVGIDIDFSQLPLKYRLILYFYYNVLVVSGVNATKTLKQSLQRGIIHRVLTVYFYETTEDTFGLPTHLFFGSVFQDVENVSHYLLKYQYLSPDFEHDGLLLQKESMLWWNLTICVQELGIIYSDNNLIKTLFLSKDILDEMVDIVDEIIEIQNKIIDQEILIK
ncbi:MAG: C39 family peptidase [Candidatus Thermoplasmatota archaeon]|nr:C39 family peptidase [Candidatus Thermoplasmatota archaeon]